MKKNYIDLCKNLFKNRNYKKLNKEKKKEYEKLIGFSLCNEMVYIIENYSEEIVDDGYCFRAVTPSPLADENGYDSVICFLGLENLFSEYETYKDRLPEGYYPIAQMDGGNLMCISKSGKIYSWMHDEPDNHMYLVGDTFSEFLMSIEKTEDLDSRNEEVICTAKYASGFWDGLKDWKE